MKKVADVFTPSGVRFFHKAFYSRMLTAIAFAGCLILTRPARAAGVIPPRFGVAVYDFSGDAALAKDALQSSSLVAAALLADTNLVILERSKLYKSSDETTLVAEGKVTSAVALRIGKITGAKALITGRVTAADGNQITISARILSTGTGEECPIQVTGAPDKIVELSSRLGGQVINTLTKQITSFTPGPAGGAGSRDDKVKRLVQAAQVGKLPTIAVDIYYPYSGKGPRTTQPEAERSLAAALVRFGFTVLDDTFKADSDLVVTGDAPVLAGPKSGQFFTITATVDIKVQDRKTGKILFSERCSSTAANLDTQGAVRAARTKAGDDMAAIIAPLMARPTGKE